MKPIKQVIQDNINAQLKTGPITNVKVIVGVKYLKIGGNLVNVNTTVLK